MGNQVTVYVRDDEDKVIQELMQALKLKRHQVIKLALRRFLFPTELSNIPLDGAYAKITRLHRDRSIYTCEQVEDHKKRRGITITRDEK